MLSCREHDIYAPWNSIIMAEIKHLKPKTDFMHLLTFTLFLMEVDRKVLLEANKNFWLKVSRWKIKILVMLTILKLYHFWCQLHVIIGGVGEGLRKSPQTLNIFFPNLKRNSFALTFVTFVYQFKGGTSATWTVFLFKFIGWRYLLSDFSELTHWLAWIL